MENLGRNAGHVLIGMIGTALVMGAGWVFASLIS